VFLCCFTCGPFFEYTPPWTAPLDPGLLRGRAHVSCDSRGCIDTKIAPSKLLFARWQFALPSLLVSRPLSLSLIENLEIGVPECAALCRASFVWGCFRKFGTVRFPKPFGLPDSYLKKPKPWPKGLMPSSVAPRRSMLAASMVLCVARLLTASLLKPIPDERAHNRHQKKKQHITTERKD